MSVRQRISAANPMGVVLVAAGVGLLAVNCSDSGSSSKQCTDCAVNEVGPAGGVITGPQGATLTIPPGALSESVVFSFERASASRGTGTLLVAGSTYRVGPEGTAFAVPAELRLPYDPQRVTVFSAVAPLQIWTAPQDGQMWSSVTSTIGTEEVSAAVSSLSDFVPAVENLHADCTPDCGQLEAGESCTIVNECDPFVASDCVAHETRPDEQVCSRPCADSTECGDGFCCKPLADGTPSETFCLPAEGGYCGAGDLGDSCDTSADCDVAQGLICVGTNRKVCSRNCVDALTDCPTDFCCRDLLGTGAPEHAFCVAPEDCSLPSIAHGSVCSDAIACSPVLDYCHTGSAASYCTSSCSGEPDCPSQFCCEDTGGSGNAEDYRCLLPEDCVLPHADMGDSCVTGTDCVGLGDGEVCHTGGTTSYCTGSCSVAGLDCPEGWCCQDRGGGQICLPPEDCAVLGGVGDDCDDAWDCQGLPECFQGSSAKYCTSWCVGQSECPTGYCCFDRGALGIPTDFYCHRSEDCQ